MHGCVHQLATLFMCNRVCPQFTLSDPQKLILPLPPPPPTHTQTTHLHTFVYRPTNTWCPAHPQTQSRWISWRVSAHQITPVTMTPPASTEPSTSSATQETAQSALCARTNACRSVRTPRPCPFIQEVGGGV